MRRPGRPRALGRPRRPSFDYPPILEIERHLCPDEAFYPAIERLPAAAVPFFREAATRIGATLVVIDGEIAGIIATDDQWQAFPGEVAAVQAERARAR